MIIGRLAIILVALILFPTVPSAGEEQVNYTNMFIRLDDQAEYGLHKLNSAERARLNEVFRGIIKDREDNLRNSALAYLRSQGWDELRITGPVQRSPTLLHR